VAKRRAINVRRVAVNDGIPRHESESTTESANRRTSVNLFKKKVTDKDSHEAFLRNALYSRVGKKLSQEMFDKWFKITEPESAAAKIEALNDRYQLKNRMTTGRLYCFLYGYGVMLMDFANDPQTFRPPRPGAPLLKLRVKSSMSALNRPKIFLGTDPRKPEYGEISKYEFNFQVEGQNRQATFHAGRTMHMAPNTINDDPFGIPDGQAIYDECGSHKTLMWACSEIIAKNARAYGFLMAPADAGDEEIDAVVDKLLDVRQGETVVLPSGWTHEEKGGPGMTLDPTRFTAPLQDTIGAGAGIPSQILMGTAAGAITGSELNLVEWFSFIAAEQADYWTPWLKEFYGKLAALGILDGVDAEALKIKWNPSFELTEAQQADVWTKEADAVARWQQAGYEVEVDGETGSIIRVVAPTAEQRAARLAARAVAPVGPAPGDITRGLNLPAPPGSRAAGAGIPEQLAQRQEGGR